MNNRHTNFLLGDNWDYNEWPDYIKVSHESHEMVRRYWPVGTCTMTMLKPPKILEGWWECSECGVVYPPCNETIATWALNYCPHCGAKVIENLEGRQCTKN